MLNSFFSVCFCRSSQALDIVKQAKVASILGEGDRRKSSGGKEKPSRRGSRESLDMAYDGEEVSHEKKCETLLLLCGTFERIKT